MLADNQRVSYKKARTIKAIERDRALGLDATNWPDPKHSPRGWTARDGAYWRTIGAGKELPVAIREAMLRFPSAPVHGLQRMHEHSVRPPVSENLHTYRILLAAQRPPAGKAVTRIFLMHVGLNERDNFGLYYLIASRLIHEDPGTVCIVRPFPGHMSRYPFQAFSETPLDRYLWDGSHLFTQFLRHMIETQWFLSALARRSSFRCASGANLLAESDERDASRLDDASLAKAMQERWMRMYRASKLAQTRASENGQSVPGLKPNALPMEHFQSSIHALRAVLDLDHDYPGQGGTLSDDDAGEPAVHVVGYSLGGFTAQSVFMSWPSESVKRIETVWSGV